MSGGQVAKCGCSCDLKARTELCKAAWWELGAPRCELQQTSHLLLREVCHGSPEPVQDAPELRGPSIHHMIGPEVSNTVLACPTQQQL